MAKRSLLTTVICGLTLLAPATVTAQEPLSELLVRLIQSEIRLAPPPPGFASHEAHFQPGTGRQLAPYFFKQQLVTQLSTFPIGSSSGGFSFTFDPSTGTIQRATQSFGPSFAERALTNGKGKLTLGANFQYSKYTSFEGQSLDNGDIKFFLRHQAETGLFFEGDLIEAALHLDLSSSTTTVFANYGVGDRWDVAVAVPILHVSIDATVDATVLRLATGDNSTLHAFPGGSRTKRFPASGSATGIGDLSVRTKYRFFSSRGGGVAAGFDLRIPSGDPQNLLGTGAAAATFSLIGSSSNGPLSPHFNFGLTGSGAGDVINVPNEVGYRVGTEYVATPRVTLSADLIGRNLLSAGGLKLGDTTWTYTDFAGVRRSTTLHEFSEREGSLNLLSVALGGKVNVTGNLLLSGNVLLALTSAGVTARITPAMGFDYSF